MTINTDFPGIDIAKFGESISVIQKRATFEHESILKELSEAVNVYKDFYQYEEITGIDKSPALSVRISRHGNLCPVSANLLHIYEDVISNIV